MMKPSMSLLFIVGLIASPAADSNSESVTLTEQMAIHSQGVNAELGRGAPQDLVKAAKWYRRAAELGYADAQNDLAKLYDTVAGCHRTMYRLMFGTAWRLIVETPVRPTTASICCNR